MLVNRRVRWQRRSRLQRNGAVMPLLAFILTAILIVVALTINSNWLLYSRINVQNTADLSARSALVKILGDTEVEGRVVRARDLGARLYNLNIDRPDFSFTPERVRFGTIADVTAAEPVFAEAATESDQITTVHVDTPATLEQQEVGVFMSSFLGGRERVRVVADATTSTRQIDIILCLDASRSMNRTSSAGKSFPPNAKTIHEPPMPGSRWFELTDTVALFVAAMQESNPSARVGLVTFGGGIVQTEHVVSDLDAEWARLENGLTVVIANGINDLVGTMESYATDFPALGLGTSLYDGLDTGLDAFENNGASRHIIMLSDGEQVAAGRPAPLVAAQAAAADGVTVHTISFGGNIGIMEDIADETGGSNFTALSEDELRDAFRQLLGRFRVQLVD